MAEGKPPPPESGKTPEPAAGKPAIEARPTPEANLGVFKERINAISKPYAEAMHLSSSLLKGKNEWRYVRPNDETSSSYRFELSQSSNRLDLEAFWGKWIGERYDIRIDSQGSDVSKIRLKLNQFHLEQISKMRDGQQLIDQIIAFTPPISAGTMRDISILIDLENPKISFRGEGFNHKPNTLIRDVLFDATSEFSYNPEDDNFTHTLSDKTPKKNGEETQKYDGKDKMEQKDFLEILDAIVHAVPTKKIPSRSGEDFLLFEGVEREEEIDDPLVREQTIATKVDKQKQFEHDLQQQCDKYYLDVLAKTAQLSRNGKAKKVGKLPWGKQFEITTQSKCAIEPTPNNPFGLDTTATSKLSFKDEKGAPVLESLTKRIGYDGYQDKPIGPDVPGIEYSVNLLGGSAKEFTITWSNIDRETGEIVGPLGYLPHIIIPEDTYFKILSGASSNGRMSLIPGTPPTIECFVEQIGKKDSYTVTSRFEFNAHKGVYERVIVPEGTTVDLSAHQKAVQDDVAYKAAQEVTPEQMQGFIDRFFAVVSPEEIGTDGNFKVKL